MTLDRPRARTLAVALWLVTTALSLVAVALMVGNLAARTSGTDPLASWGLPGFGSVFGLTFGTVGFIVARRLPANVIGWIFGAIGLLFSIEAFLIEYATAAIVTFPGRLPAGQGLAWILAWIWVAPVLLATNVLPLVFPTGHLSSARWRLAVWIGVGALVVSSAILAVVPGPITQVPFVQNPVGIPGLELSSPVAGTAIFIPLLLAIALGAGGLLHRFRAATGDARQQIKWLLLACSGVGLGLLLSGGEYVLTGRQTKPFQIIVLVAALGIPVAAGLAILRYRLYEIDRIISRTVSYAVVTGVLAAVFAGGVVGLAVVTPLSGAADPIPVAGSTLIVAVLFQPLRRRVQAFVDRRFDRARVDAERTVAELAERLRDEVELASVRREVLATVGRALRPSEVVVWLRER
jgi:hypothetical protein